MSGNDLKLNREAWLQAMILELRPYFDYIGLPLPPKVHVSCGWPSKGGTGTRKRVIGQCWNAKCSSDGVPQIFISPTIVETVEVGATLVHELLHAAVGTEAAHGPKFAKPAVKLGLEGKPTDTVAGDLLAQRLNAMAVELGPYPHALLTVEPITKKQGTRLVKILCGVCGYTARTTRKWIDDVGFPTCACGGEMEEAG